MKHSLTILFLLPLLAFAQDSLNLSVKYHWEDPSLPGGFFYNNQYNEVWGWHNPADDREYAILGTTIGLHFFDLTDPNNISEVAFVRGNVDTLVIHRDFKNKDNYLYAVSDELEGTLQVIDMSYLPDSVHVVYDSDEFFQRSHNIWVDGDHLYACIPRLYNPGGPPPPFPGLAIYDISNPEVPSLIKEYPYSDFSNIHDLYTHNDTAWLNAEENGLYVVDFTDPLNHEVLIQLNSYPFQGYNHSGWVNDDRSIYVMADETHGSPLKVYEIDFANLDLDFQSYLSPSIASGNPVADPSAIPHNPLIRDNLVFASYYYDGLYIFDIDDPTNPQIAGYYDTFLDVNDESYEGCWGVYPYLPSGLILGSDMQTGLYVFEFDETPTSVDENLAKQFRVFPNPVADVLRVQALDEGLMNPTLQLFDLSGKVVTSTQLSGYQSFIEWNIDMDLSGGMYMLGVESEGKRFVKKVIIQ